MHRAETTDHNAVIAGFLGWTFDAFDFFVVTFVLFPIATTFNRSLPQVTLAITASLVTRPIGALLFGLLADRYGRRIPLMLDILLYSLVEVLSGLAPSFKVFIFLRLLYGIGMGGEWGVGTSLAMESVPAKWRGLISGLLQEGYAMGYLLAAIAYGFAFPRWGWRSLFFIGGLPALLTLFIRARVKESPAWERTASRISRKDYARAIVKNLRLFAYLTGLMALMNFISHGTQDFYPTFLQQQHHWSPQTTAFVTVIAMIGAMLGGLTFGLLSDVWGRRRAMLSALALAFIFIPLWVLAPSLRLILTGAFLMQFMVQGAWGVVPAHLSELSPDSLRGFFPGMAYQLGVVFASVSAYAESLLTQHMTYGQAMACFAGTVLILGMVAVGVGPEAHRVRFGRMEGNGSGGAAP
jgi:SHS family lactate transporter-like MFS transporter